MLIRRLARPMLAAVFIAGGVDALRNPAPRVKAATPLVAKGEQALPNDVTDKFPTDPDTLVKANAGVQIAGGVLLATGHLPRLASLVLAGTLVPTTAAGHPFWEEKDAQAKAAQRTQFLKNVSLLGGLLIAAVDTEGKPSVAWRTRKSATRAQQVARAALPFVAAGGSSTADSLRDAAQTAADRSQELAHRVADHDTTKKLTAGGTGLAVTAAHRAQELAHQVADSDTTKRLAAQGQDLAHTAAQRGSVLATQSGKRGRTFAATARTNVDHLAGAAAVRAEDMADERGRRGRKTAKKARKNADRLSAEAAARSQVLATQAQSRAQLLAAQAQTRAQLLAAQAQVKRADRASATR